MTEYCDLLCFQKYFLHWYEIFVQHQFPCIWWHRTRFCMNITVYKEFGGLCEWVIYIVLLCVIWMVVWSWKLSTQSYNIEFCMWCEHCFEVRCWELHHCVYGIIVSPPPPIHLGRILWFRNFLHVCLIGLWRFIFLAPQVDGRNVACKVIIQLLNCPRIL